MKPKNLKEFKALIKRYESITLDEIKEAFEKSKLSIFLFDNAANELTGFGNFPNECILCGSVEMCEQCIYGNDGCVNGKNRKTYNKIENADTPLKLFSAYRARAKHMKTLII